MLRGCCEVKSFSELNIIIIVFCLALHYWLPSKKWLLDQVSLPQSSFLLRLTHDRPDYLIIISVYFDFDLKKNVHLVTNNKYILCQIVRCQIVPQSTSSLAWLTTNFNLIILSINSNILPLNGSRWNVTPPNWRALTSSWHLGDDQFWGISAHILGVNYHYLG